MAWIAGVDPMTEDFVEKNGLRVPVVRCEVQFHCSKLSLVGKVQP